MDYRHYQPDADLLDQVLEDERADALQEFRERQDVVIDASEWPDV